MIFHCCIKMSENSFVHIIHLFFSNTFMIVIHFVLYASYIHHNRRSALITPFSCSSRRSQACADGDAGDYVCKVARLASEEPITLTSSAGNYLINHDNWR